MTNMFFTNKTKYSYQGNKTCWSIYEKFKPTCVSELFLWICVHKTLSTKNNCVTIHKSQNKNQIMSPPAEMWKVCNGFYSSIRKNEIMSFSKRINWKHDIQWQNISNTDNYPMVSIIKTQKLIGWHEIKKGKCEFHRRTIESRKIRMNNINGDYDVQMWKCHKEMPYFMLLICTNNKIFLILRSLMNNHNTVE